MEMVEVKTAELVGSALDWSTACALNGSKEFFSVFGAKFLGMSLVEQALKGNIRPSTDWYQGGPLIDLLKVETMCNLETGERQASTDYLCDWVSGDNTLMAVCRAIVMEKLGETVLVPKELVK